jgi:large subunit ribosomal protein L37Ae
MPGSTKRLGSRYGRRIRKKLDDIETAQKTKYKCPYCHKNTARRMAVGIWKCPKCDSTFTGKAYTITKAKIFEEATGAEGALAEIKLREEKQLKEAEPLQADMIPVEQPVEEMPLEEEAIVEEQ